MYWVKRHSGAKPAQGGITLLYKQYRYVLSKGYGLLSLFGLKTGIDFDNYGLKSGLVFKKKKTTRVSQYGDRIRLKRQKLFA